MLSAFPHLTAKEFEQACIDLRQRYHRGSSQDDWQSVEIVHSFDATYLRIIKELNRESGPLLDSNQQPQQEAIYSPQHDVEEQDEFQEDDDEALRVVSEPQPFIHYDILLSPVYRIPVLYFSISDPQHRYLPTMATLYKHVIPSQFKAQAESAGVIGGVTINDHPVTNRPVFFIHPCRTAEVMQASVGNRDIAAEEYLLMWIGALGQCVGLNIPLALVQHDIQPVVDTKNS
jgi:ubiquitin-like-conjugating enzyme ATG10